MGIRISLPGGTDTLSAAGRSEYKAAVKESKFSINLLQAQLKKTIISDRKQQILSAFLTERSVL